MAIFIFNMFVKSSALLYSTGKSIQMESIEAKEIVAKSKLRVNGVLNVTSDTTIAKPGAIFRGAIQSATGRSSFVEIKVSFLCSYSKRYV